MVITIANAVNVKLSQIDVQDVYRLPMHGTNNTVIVDIASPILKSKILAGVRKYNSKNKERPLDTSCLGSSTEPQVIFVSENLTPKARRLHFLARDFAKSNDFDFCWSTNGKIFLRKKVGAKQILVKTPAQLETLKNLI